MSHPARLTHSRLSFPVRLTHPQGCHSQCVLPGEAGTHRHHFRSTPLHPRHSRSTPVISAPPLSFPLYPCHFRASHVIPAQAGIHKHLAITAPLAEAAVMQKSGYVYILASKQNGTLYIGVTSNLVKRTYEHRNEVMDGFSKKYGTKLLVYYEAHDEIAAAITSEKQMKKWNRAWKIRLIEDANPTWRDLYGDITR